VGDGKARDWKALLYGVSIGGQLPAARGSGNAIAELTRGVREAEQHPVLLGVTGSGKTFTMAKVIEAVGRPDRRKVWKISLGSRAENRYPPDFPKKAS